MGPNYRTKAADLYNAYKTWCDQQGVVTTVQRTWGMALTERGFERKRGTAGSHWWIGIGMPLKPFPGEETDAQEENDTQVTQVTDSDPKNGINRLVNSSRGENRKLGSLGSLGSLPVEADDDLDEVDEADEGGPKNGSGGGDRGGNSGNSSLPPCRHVRVDRTMPCKDCGLSLYRRDRPDTEA